MPDKASIVTERSPNACWGPFLFSFFFQILRVLMLCCLLLRPWIFL